MSDQYSSARTTTGEMYVGNQSYKGLGAIKWCLICTRHRPTLGGTTRLLGGTRHFVCADHVKPALIKEESNASTQDSLAGTGMRGGALAVLAGADSVGLDHLRDSVNLRGA